MARRRSISIRPVVQPRTVVVVRLRPPVRRLSLVEDRRQFHPERDFRPARSFFNRPRLVVRAARKAPNVSKSLMASLSHRIGFEVPKRVVTCIRRKERREVLIAMGAGGSHKPKRRNYWSSVQC